MEILEREDPDVGWMFNYLYEGDLNDIIRRVNYKADEITCSKKPTVVIVGNDQVGKSTLIGALLEFEFEVATETRIVTNDDGEEEEEVYKITKESLKEMGKK